MDNGIHRQYFESDIIKAELLALIQGLKIAFSRNLKPLEINVDCQVIISLIYENIDSKYTNVLVDCRNLFHQIGSPPISHSYRKTNSIADALAREGANMYILKSLNITEDSPPFIQRKWLLTRMENFLLDLKVIQSLVGRTM